MNLVVITTEGFDTFSGNNHLNESLLIYLSKQFEEITYIQSFRSGPYAIPKEILELRNVSIESINRAKISKNNIIVRFFEEIFFFNKVYKKVFKLLLSKKKPNYILIQLSGLSYFLLSKLKKFNIPIIYNMQDLFPETLITTELLKPKNIIYKIYKLIQVYSFKFVKKFTVLSKDIKSNLIKNYGVNKNSIYIIPNWISDKNISSISLKDNLFAKKYNLNKNKFIIQYAGNLGRVLDYKFIISIAKKLENLDHFEIQIVGSGSQREYLEKLIKLYKVTNIKIYDIQPQTIVNHVYSYADIEIIPLKENVLYSSVPSKLPFLLNLCVPTIIIGNKDTFYLKDLMQNRVVFGYSNDEVNEACNFIIKYKARKRENSDFDNERIKKSYQFSMKNFSSSKVLNKLSKIFKNE
jgi:glycosyltransferase involved in cell wall biosynthesis